jgi:protein subunit release factor A
MNNQIWEYVKYGLWILFGSGILLEITPIKINPISSVLGWIGNKLNKSVKDEISQLNKDVKEVKSDLQEHTVESQRRDILNFANELRLGLKKTEEHFNYIMKLHDRYEKYTEANNIKNSQADLAFEYITLKYKEFRDSNSFL